MFFSSNKKGGCRLLAGSARLPAISALAALLLCACGFFATAMAAAATSPWQDGAVAEEAGRSSGASYELLFTGNRFFSERQLRAAAAEELADFERLGLRKAEADDAAFQMELAYKEAGFAMATVDYRYELKDGSLRLSFLVNEGPRVSLKEIMITGNSFFDTSTLRKFFQPEQGRFLAADGKLFYVEAAVSSALSDIRDHYIGEGFLDVEVKGAEPEFGPDHSEATLRVEIREGPRYLIRGLEFTGDLLPEAASALQQTAAELEGKPYFRRRDLLIRSRVLEIYGNLGYPETGVEVAEKARDATGDVILTATIRSGPRVSIGATTIGGNEKTRWSFIDSRLRLDSGAPYSLSKKRESFQALYETGLFSTIDLSLQPSGEPDKRNLAIKVTEAPSRELSLDAGWGSYELLRLGLGFRDKNFLGTGRIVRTEVQYSLKGESALAGITDPWFLGTDIVADLPFSYKRRIEPSFTRQETGSSLLFSKKISQSLLATLGYSFRFTSISNVDVNTLLENPDTGYNMASIKAQAAWDTRNDPFFPSAGYKNFLAAEIADSVLGSQVDLVRFTAGSRYFRPVTNSITLGVRYSTGFTLPGTSQVTLPLGERFYNGGENTVRSFRESQLGPKDLNGQPVGGMAFNVASLELRRRLTEDFAASLFADCGNVSPNRSRAEEGQPAFTERSQVIETTAREFFRDFRTGLGAGIEYLLPVGPIRLDLAVNPSPDEERHEDRYNIHFSMGMAF